MKKISIFLILIIVVVIGILITIKINNYDIYKEQEHVQYNEVLTNTNEPTIYYYYQDTCHFCKSIKSQVTDISKIINNTQGINIKLVDMKDPKNNKSWYDWDEHNKKYGQGTSPETNPDYISNPKDMKTYEDIKITGTPTMIYVKNNQVIDYKVGSDVFDILESVNKEFNLGYTFDRSKYGKN